jgi:hypothetical protein
MTTPAVLEPLIAAGVTATVRFDGRLAVRPADRITPGLDAYLRRHRDELIAELSDQRPLSAVLHHPPSTMPRLWQRRGQHAAGRRPHGTLRPMPPIE